VRKSDLTVLSGEDLIRNVQVWNPVTASYAQPAAPAAFNRFCSADLPALSAFYDAATGMSFNGRLFMNGEEAGSEGRAFAHGLDGTSWELPRLGKLSFENVVANPATGEKTLGAETGDSTRARGHREALARGSRPRRAGCEIAEQPRRPCPGRSFGGGPADPPGAGPQAPFPT